MSGLRARGLLLASSALLALGATACEGGDADPTPLDGETPVPGDDTPEPGGDTPEPGETPDPGNEETPTPSPDLTPGPTPGPYERPEALMISTNPNGVDADVLMRLLPDLSRSQATFQAAGFLTSVQSVTLAPNGDGYLSYDGHGDAGGIMRINALHTRGTSTVGSGNGSFGGTETGMRQPRGVIATQSYVLVADIAAMDLKAFNRSEDGNVAPAFVVSDFGSEGRVVWDMAYDADEDRLFAAATDGAVLVFDGFTENEGQGGPDRIFYPADAEGQQISVNLHGIVYLADQDRLILSDVGDPELADDGQIFAIDLASEAEDMAQASLRLSGSNTMLGNPVDLAYVGADLYVAEKSGNKLLRFAGFPDLTGVQNKAPIRMVDMAMAESLAMTGEGSSGRLFAVSNPDGRDQDALVRMPFSLNNTEVTLTGFGNVASLQSLTVDHLGDGYVTLDLHGNLGGVMMLGGLADRTTGARLRNGDGILYGPATGLVAPRGLTVSGDALIVADFGAEDIKVFMAGRTGDVGPNFVAGIGEGRSVWDIAYDPAADRLFAAGTDGAVLVYDSFLADKAVEGPDRMIVPVGADDAQVSVNLHGIAYDFRSDTLFLSDVGDTQSASDGRIFSLAGASTAEGDTGVRTHVSGEMSLLGNPVDIAFDGRDLYVAEKGNDVVMRFEDALNLTGEMDLEAIEMLSVTRPESVVTIAPAE